MKTKFIPKLFITVVSLFLLLSQNASADIYDNFNDGVIDTHKWDIIECWGKTSENMTNPAAPVYEANGSLNIDYPPSSSWGGLRSKTFFAGDFDIRTEWKNWQFDGFPSTHENYITQIGIDVQPGDGSDSETSYIFRGGFPNMPEEYHDLYVSNARVNGQTYQAMGDVTTPTDTSGYFGIQRVGSTISTYHSDTNHSDYNNWELLHQAENAFTEPIKLNLSAYTGDNTNHFHAEWDNVEVEAEKEVDIDSWNVGRKVIEWLDRFKTSNDLLSLLNNMPVRPLGTSLPSILIPPEILMANELESDPLLIYQYSEFFEEYFPTFGYITFSPVDIQVIDPLGNSIGKTHNDLVNALYFEGDFWDIGLTNDLVLFWDPLYGDYEINVIPEVGALPGDTFSLLAFDDTAGKKYVSTLAFGEDATNQSMKNFNYNNSVPEPSSLFLLCSGLFGFYATRKKTRNYR